MTPYFWKSMTLKTKFNSEGQVSLREGTIG